ncbi:uncharacterized protein LOC108097149 [Drosophila ficusphila]|uniref:uncharacterized protein LOC108097149 n=1 Tax=Drosophila ficusphila TaxID=30025 RepID=UPI0007E77925|nr:uncharacterized protein LOC108097149 [Drosophila ficusphila]
MSGAATRSRSEDPGSRIGLFHTQAELMALLPALPKLRDTFDLFVANGSKPPASGDSALRFVDGCASIDLSDVADCLRAMGLSPGEDWMRDRLAEQLRRREALGPEGARFARRATFELVLTLYCALAPTSEGRGPTAAEVLQVLRSRDPAGTGMLPYSQLRRMLTSTGERLDEAEVFGLLHSVADVAGNVHYEPLVQQLFARHARADGQPESEAEEALRQAGLYLQAVGRHAVDMDMAKRDEFIEALRREDPLGTGFIESGRLLELLNRSEERFSAEELQLLTQGMEDTSCERGVNYRRFLYFIMDE